MVAGPQTSQWTHSRGLLVTEKGELKGSLQLLPYLQYSQKERAVDEPLSETVEAEKMCWQIVEDGWPNRWCQTSADTSSPRKAVGHEELETRGTRKWVQPIFTRSAEKNLLQRLFLNRKTSRIKDKETIVFSKLVHIQKISRYSRNMENTIQVERGRRCVNRRGTSIQNAQTLTIPDWNLVLALISRMNGRIIEIMCDMIRSPGISIPSLVRNRVEGSSHCS